MIEGIRARRRNQTDEELLLAHFFEDLSPAGRAAVSSLLEERLGPIDAYVARFAREQGDEQGRILARHAVLEPGGDGESPAMRGTIVLAGGGLGFVPRGPVDDEPIRPRSMGFGFVGIMVTQIASDLAGYGRKVPNLTRPRVPVPLPLLARLDPHALWLPASPAGSLRQSADGSEVHHAGAARLACDAYLDSDPAAIAWATRLGWRAISFTVDDA
ncbi:MAG TPA: hypothetical protein VHE35_00400 [Kofleriaceae bacterium]|nr:hypothetical protein [Kofleriaceae bacterium]